MKSILLIYKFLKEIAYRNKNILKDYDFIYNKSKLSYKIYIVIKLVTLSNQIIYSNILF
jgi:hypothetical protein